MEARPLRSEKVRKHIRNLMNPSTDVVMTAWESRKLPGQHEADTEMNFLEAFVFVNTFDDESCTYWRDGRGKRERFRFVIVERSFHAISLQPQTSGGRWTTGNSVVFAQSCCPPGAKILFSLWTQSCCVLSISFSQFQARRRAKNFSY
jgi:hypothetical protein